LTYPSEKYESQWEGLSHILWKIKFMFQTTNQFPSQSLMLEIPNCDRIGVSMSREGWKINGMKNPIYDHMAVSYKWGGLLNPPKLKPS
jgi:hypothetical protein